MTKRKARMNEREQNTCKRFHNVKWFDEGGTYMSYTVFKMSTHFNNYGRFWMPDRTLQYYRKNTEWGNIIWNNGETQRHWDLATVGLVLKSIKTLFISMKMSLPSSLQRYSPWAVSLSGSYWIIHSFIPSVCWLTLMVSEEKGLSLHDLWLRGDWTRVKCSRRNKKPESKTERS